MTTAEPSAGERRRSGASGVAGLAFAAVSLGVVWAGQTALVVFASVAGVLAYLELRRILGQTGGALNLAAGAASVVGLVYLASRGEIADLPWILAGLVVVSFVTRIVGIELGRSRVEGTTAEAGATVAAAGLVGVTGAHVLLVRSEIRYGFEGLVLFALVVLTAGIVSAAANAVAGRRPLAERIDPRRTWEGATAGLLAATIAGTVCGAVVDPPFDATAGALLGAMSGVLFPIGEIAGAALKRGAGLSADAGYLPGSGGVFDLLVGPLVVAPAYYWAFRTLVL